MNDIQDQVAAAIQTYANALPNPEFRINLLAAAEHMAPELIRLLGLQQEWALITGEKYDVGTENEHEEIGEVRYNSEDPTVAFNELEWRREKDYGSDAWTRDYVGTRIMTEWAEVHPIILNEDEQKQMDIDQASILG
jgi:hypothetical protein